MKYFSFNSNAKKWQPTELPTFVGNIDAPTVTATTVNAVTVNAPTVNASTVAGVTATFTGTVTANGVTATTVTATTVTATTGAITTLNINGTGSSQVNITSSNAYGGPGYAGFLTLTNTTAGATNPNKYIRTNTAGTLEVVNSAYDAVVFQLSDTGIASIAGMTSAAGWIGEVLTARSSTTQTGGASANIIGNVSITLTPGTWLVQAFGTLIMSVTTDGVSCGIYNVTGSAEVASSRGMGGLATTTASHGAASMPTVITVASNTVYAAYLCRNGSSTLATSVSAGAAANSITALRIR